MFMKNEKYYIYEKILLVVKILLCCLFDWYYQEISFKYCLCYRRYFKFSIRIQATGKTDFKDSK